MDGEQQTPAPRADGDRGSGMLCSAASVSRRSPTAQLNQDLKFQSTSPVLWTAKGAANDLFG
jgi:hypothetical protein